MIPTDDARRLLTRETALADGVGRQGLNPAFGSPSVLAATTSLGAYPGTAQSYFACTPLTLLGTEREGASGDVTTGSATFFALNLGTTVPPAGTQVLTTFVGNRWVFRHDA